MSDTLLTNTRTLCFIATAHPEEARAFYEATLKLRFLGDDTYGLSFAVGDALTLRVQKVWELQPQPFTVFGWLVKDIEATLTQLAERGVRFEAFGFPTQDTRGICTFENGDRVAWFKDPDGNTLSITQSAD